MRIAVLDVTGHPLPLLEGLPRVGEQIISWLSPALPEATFRWFDIEENGEDLPDVDAFDGLVLSGSEHGVYDATPWNRPLRIFLLRCKAQSKPVFGICFGHQMMADTFGGHAENANLGVIVGARAFEFGETSQDAHVWRKDQVTIVPPGARITAHAPYCPVGALEYDFPAASVQFHPEYSEYQLCEIFRRARDHFLTGDEADDAVQSFAQTDVKTNLMAYETATFFRKYIK